MLTWVQTSSTLFLEFSGTLRIRFGFGFDFDLNSDQRKYNLHFEHSKKFILNKKTFEKFAIWSIDVTHAVITLLYSLACHIFSKSEYFLRHAVLNTMPSRSTMQLQNYVNKLHLNHACRDFTKINMTIV